MRRRRFLRSYFHNLYERANSVPGTSPCRVGDQQMLGLRGAYSPTPPLDWLLADEISEGLAPSRQAARRKFIRPLRSIGYDGDAVRA